MTSKENSSERTAFKTGYFAGLENEAPSKYTCVMNTKQTAAFMKGYLKAQMDKKAAAS